MVNLKTLIKVILFSLILLITGCTNQPIQNSVSVENRDDKIEIKEKRRFGIYSAAPMGDNVNGVISVLEDLNIKEISYLGSYGLHQAQLSGNYDKFDEFYQKASQNKINIVPWIRARNHSNCSQVDTVQMRDYFKSVVARYPDIKYWKILKEPDKRCLNTPRMDSDNDISNPIDIAKTAKNTLNSVCPDCKLVWGGFGPQVNKYYYESLLKNNFYDNFNIHGLLGYHWEHLDYRPKTNKEEWIIQTSLPNELSEMEYAKESLKVFVYFFSLGFDRIYYDQIYDFGSQSELFGSRGLVTKAGTKKEVYSSFKTMVNKLDSFISITTISDCNAPRGSKVKKGPDGNCQYRFNFKDKNPVYVLWCDSNNCHVPSEISGTVKVTNYLGKELVDDANNIVFSRSPIFIESY